MNSSPAMCRRSTSTKPLDPALVGEVCAERGVFIDLTQELVTVDGE